MSTLIGTVRGVVTGTNAASQGNYLHRSTHALADARIVLREWLRTGNGKLAAIAVACFVVYLWWLFFGGPAHRVLIANIANLPFELAGALSALVAARHAALSPRTRRAWLFVGLAMLSDGVGNVIWLVYENVFGLSPETSWADAVYLCYYP